MSPSGRNTSPSKAEKAYWDGVWTARRGQRYTLLEERWDRDFLIRRFDRLAARNGWLSTHGKISLLEIGCARSLWLPYFAQRWGYHVEGLDYSEEGVRQAEEVLRRHGANGTIHLGDFLGSPAALEGRFDVVLSVGVVEHFEDRAACMAAFRSFLKPSGLLITLIPNLCGAMGTITRVFTPDIWRRHIPTSREQLAESHAESGFRLLHCDYFLPLYLGVINFERLRPALFRSVVAGGSALLSMAIAYLMELSGRPMTSRRFSPYILAVAKLPEESPTLNSR